MLIGSVAFLAGIMLLQAQSNLPSLYWSGALLLIPLLRKIPALRIPLWMLAGFLWALLFATLALDERLDPSLEGQDLVITGTVGSIPQVREPGLRFRFDVDENPELPRQVLLSWYGRHEGISAGQRWRLRVRLKQPNGLMNPGSFDYEKWLFQQGIHAVGYIREDEEQVNVLLEESAGGVNIDRLREYLYRKIQQALVDDPNAGVIAALAIGEWQDMSHEQWDLLTRTGTSHLMTISGMHISLVAGFVFFLFRWSWRRVAQLVELIPAKKAAALAGMTAAMVYAALAGFTIPTQRALVMLGVVFGGVILLRTLTPARTLALALLAVLLIDPLAVLSYGFWLSFASVAIILFGMHGQLSATGLWQRWGRVHWVIFVGLTPLTLLLFRQIMGGAPLANLVAVPLVETTVVPLTLIGTLLTPLFDTAGAALLQVASWLLDRLWLWLEWVAEFRWAQWWQHVPPLWTVACGLVGMVLLLSPKGIPGRWLGWLWMMPMVLILPARPLPGEFSFTLLDVGQGLAAVIRTHQHTLIYDTGPKLSESFDTGSAVVVPFLQQAGVVRPDRVIISHGDNDHAGGLDSVLKVYPETPILSIRSKKLTLTQAESCQSGQQWHWDGVTFQVIYPPEEKHKKRPRAENNNSCVLRVSSPGGSVLLTGDIEGPAEKYLVNSLQQQLPADVLVAPHHGSKTSSTEGLIETVAPELVLFPVGYRNRYGFPNPQVVARYQQAGIQQMDSASHGAITINFGVTKAALRPISYRQENRHYWNR